MVIALLILASCSLGVIAGFFIATEKVIKKFDRLDSTARQKLLLLEYYIAVVRNFSREDLIKLSAVADEEIRHFNTIKGCDERMQAIWEKISPGKPLDFSFLKGSVWYHGGQFGKHGGQLKKHGNGEIGRIPKQ
jgi:hypothetical protein